jgi:hypothetical protein
METGELMNRSEVLRRHKWKIWIGAEIIW